MRNSILKIAFAASAMLLANSPMHSAPNKYVCLAVETASGGRDYYNFNTNPQITFNGADVTISSTQTTTTYPSGELTGMFFGGSHTDSESILKEYDLVFERRSHNDVFVGGRDAKFMRVVGIDGVVRNTIPQIPDDGIVVSLSSLPQGVYVIVINDKKSIKILK